MYTFGSIRISQLSVSNVLLKPSCRPGRRPSFIVRGWARAQSFKGGAILLMTIEGGATRFIPVCVHYTRGRPPPRFVLEVTSY